MKYYTRWCVYSPIDEKSLPYTPAIIHDTAKDGVSIERGLDVLIECQIWGTTIVVVNCESQS